MFTLLLIAMIFDEAATETSGTQDAGFGNEEVVNFETRVRPVLADRCFQCHGPEKQWAGLRLDSRAAILKGGENGPAIVPGNPDASLLIRAVRHDDPDLQMPQGEKLTLLEIDALTQWVQSGAVFPGSVSSVSQDHRAQHWSFQPLKKIDVPDVSDSAWPQSDLDRFVLARLRSAGIDPAPKADKRTLIRRVTFDLTGLPPTPEEIESFLTDENASAYQRVIDRLLESDAYGERWARHWLDVARYADSNGLDENIAHGNAWRYRDYVVQAINSDKPFDRFIIEQIAGDLLEAGHENERCQNLIATGFLSIGPKVLAEVNMPKMRMDIVDEQLDTVGRVFMGMTFGCARCHDHKFDPISTADYYGLAGIFKSTRTMETYTKVAKWHEHLLINEEARTTQAEYETLLASRKTAVDDLIANANKLTKVSDSTEVVEPDVLESRYSDETKTQLAMLRQELADLKKSPPEHPAAMGVAEDEIGDVAILLRGDPARPGDIVPRHVPAAMSGPASVGFDDDRSGRMELARWLIDRRHPLTSRVLVNRFWRWHFGKGIVRSTDNFGLLGDLPDHPELLDWLAQKFIDDGWSLKSFHRMILTSSTYQQSSQVSTAAAEHDPENRMLSRFSVRRLDAEEIRDSMLSVSGQLDRRVGGSLLKVKNRGYLFDHTSIDVTDYTSNRRSLYLPVIRNNVFDFFQLLDFPDPAVPKGDRSNTTIATQALMMMNSDFVMKCAEDLSQRVMADCENESKRLRAIYLLTLGRQPSDDEFREDIRFLESAKRSSQELNGIPATQTDEREAWSVLCHVMLSSSEFLYVQ